MGGRELHFKSDREVDVVWTCEKGRTQSHYALWLFREVCELLLESCTRLREYRLKVYAKINSEKNAIVLKNIIKSEHLYREGRTLLNCFYVTQRKFVPSLQKRTVTQHDFVLMHSLAKKGISAACVHLCV